MSDGTFLQHLIHGFLRKKIIKAAPCRGRGTYLLFETETASLSLYLEGSYEAVCSLFFFDFLKLTWSSPWAVFCRHQKLPPPRACVRACMSVCVCVSLTGELGVSIWTSIMLLIFRETLLLLGDTCGSCIFHFM